LDLCTSELELHSSGQLRSCALAADPVESGSIARSEAKVRGDTDHERDQENGSRAPHEQLVSEHGSSSHG
jgi:hypothetical protein